MAVVPDADHLVRPVAQPLEFGSSGPVELALTVAGAIGGWAEALEVARAWGGKPLPLARLLLVPLMQVVPAYLVLHVARPVVQ